jgi:hypothetical protein
MFDNLNTNEMVNLIKSLFGKKKAEYKDTLERFSEEEFTTDYDLKAKGLENVLGKMNGLVGHAIIPFYIGGSVDMYYFTSHLPGTGFATMELLLPDGTGPKPNTNGTYELVAFTRLPFESMQVENPTPFNITERRICGIFTTIGFYSKTEVIKPYETCEIPTEGEENPCIIFDEYQPSGNVFMIGNRKHHLLLCLEIFKQEMQYAMENGGKQLIQKLIDAGHYPYSDLDREPVV